MRDGVQCPKRELRQLAQRRCIARPRVVWDLCRYFALNFCFGPSHAVNSHEEVVSSFFATCVNLSDMHLPAFFASATLSVKACGTSSADIQHWLLRN
jgi:hypothetical protein